MDTPLTQKKAKSRSGGPGPVPVNPSTVPGPRANAVHVVPSPSGDTFKEPIEPPAPPTPPVPPTPLIPHDKEHVVASDYPHILHDRSVRLMQPTTDGAMSARGIGPSVADAPDYPFSPLFAPGFLAGQTGRVVRVESLTGNTLTERVGRLMRVGADYILLQSVEGHNMVCDLHAVRFVTIVPMS